MQSVDGTINWLPAFGPGISSRSGSSHGKEDARKEELRVDIARLHEQHQRGAYDQIPQYRNPPHAQPVGYETPDGTGHERHDLIRETQRPDTAARSTTLA